MGNDPRPSESGCHVILVAIAVHGESREAAERSLYERLPRPDDQIADDHTVTEVVNPVECWWIAEDERYDRSDNDSAVFVRMGAQREGADALQRAGVAGS